jgi:transposase
MSRRGSPEVKKFDLFGGLEGIMGIKHIVRLSNGERKELERLIRFGVSSTRRNIRARILLKSDQGENKAWLSDEEIAEAVEVSKSTVFCTRKRFVEEGLERAQSATPASPRPHKRKLDGKAEARLIALTCGQPPKGQAKRTLQLLSDQMVELKYVEQSISDDLVQRTLKKTNLSLGRRSNG